MRRAALLTLALACIPAFAQKRCDTCVRDSRGRIKRSSTARREFMRITGYPHGKPGYVIDHIKPLECGGTDSPGNMQWQTRDEAKQKDKTEKKCENI